MRGQATVELALGSIIFVGALLGGIHLAEYAQLSLKVQDAQTFAVWSSTGHRVQRRELDGQNDTFWFERTLDSSNGIGAQAEQRFEDFDGLSSSDNGNVIARALTQGSKLKVRCFEDRALSWPATVSARAVLADTGGLACESSAEVKAINAPRTFLQREGGGFFDLPVVRREPIKVCGMGFPRAGACQGQLSLLTNDWGLAGRETEESCTRAFGCDGSKAWYRGMIQRLWAPGYGAGRSFAESFAGSPGSDANEFHFSYSGVEHEMEDFVGGEGRKDFVTGGGRPGFIHRPNCFLGMACPQ